MSVVVTSLTPDADRISSKQVVDQSNNEAPESLLDQLRRWRTRLVRERAILLHAH